MKILGLNLPLLFGALVVVSSSFAGPYHRKPSHRHQRDSSKLTQGKQHKQNSKHIPRHGAQQNSGSRPKPHATWNKSSHTNTPHSKSNNTSNDNSIQTLQNQIAEIESELQRNIFEMRQEEQETTGLLLKLMATHGAELGLPPSVSQQAEKILKGPPESYEKGLKDLLDSMKAIEEKPKPDPGII